MLFEEESRPKNLAFGTTAHNRPTFPTEIAHDCFGNNQTPLRGVPNLGPGAYENEEKTSLTYVIDRQPISRRGYSLNARTEKRECFETKDNFPAPNAYQPSLTRPATSKRAFKPFDSAAQRFSGRVRSADVPGPGSYEVDVKQNRQVQMLHSFGGRTKLIPAVKTKCVPFNVDKCLMCHKTPNGDYYQYRREVLCSSCFQYHWQWEEKLKRAHLQAFEKVRDCSQIHEHAGTKAKIQLAEKDYARKLQRKEAYLSLYWS